MTTPETRARLGALEQQLTAPTPAPLDGQTAIPLPPDPDPVPDCGEQFTLEGIA